MFFSRINIVVLKTSLNVTFCDKGPRGLKPFSWLKLIYWVSSDGAVQEKQEEA